MNLLVTYIGLSLAHAIYLLVLLDQIRFTNNSVANTNKGFVKFVLFLFCFVPPFWIAVWVTGVRVMSLKKLPRRDVIKLSRVK